MPRSSSVSAFAAAWLACLVPALAGAVELYFAGTFPLQAGLIAMGLYHAIIGIIEEKAQNLRRASAESIFA